VPGRVDTPVSTLDLGPTLGDLAGIDTSEIAPWSDGTSLIPVAKGAERGPVPIEYAAEASISPIVALRDGPWKYIRCASDPDQLFNLADDPCELTDLAQDPTHEDTLARLSGLADARWDLDRFDADVRASQARRWVVYEALRKGGHYPWDFQPLQKASERYMRNHKDLNALEESQRFPRGE
jgi:choline-sulfatase